MTELDTIPTADEPTTEADRDGPARAPGLEPEVDPGLEADTELDPDGLVEAAVDPAPDAEPEPDAIAEAAVDAEPEPEQLADTGPRTVGRFIADALRAAGVRYAFTVPGESFLGLLDAFEGAGIRVIGTRHEGAAAFMAEAHGQLTGRPAICLGTRAVGGSNMAIGIHTARQDSTSMFVAVGQVERAYQGREAFQEIDQVESLGRLAKWAAEPRTAAEVVSIMTEATRQALTGRPGPVLLSLPEDLLDEIMPRMPWSTRPGPASRAPPTTRSAPSSNSLPPPSARSSSPAAASSARAHRPS